MTRGHVIAAIAIIAGILNIGTAVLGYTTPVADRMVIGIALLGLGLYYLHLISRVSRSD
jgi:hypothetical protein